MDAVDTPSPPPALPARIGRLRDLAYNLWWSWHPECLELFARVDPAAWRAAAANPARWLALTSPDALTHATHDGALLAAYDAVVAAFDRYLAAPGWFARTYPASAARVAYFCAEFALTEVLPIYSGGLGVLAGDHVKSASDLGLPLVAVGLAYGEGYHRQALAPDGWQGERYPRNEFAALPVTPVVDARGLRVGVAIELPDRAVRVQLWRAQVGRVPLYLLDTDVPSNTADDRRITARLYGGDGETRLLQELVLGIGGVRALRALGVDANVFHLNEGHSAFLALERLRATMRAAGLPLAPARWASRAGHVFTTHTPVPAGHDEFPSERVEWYLRPFREAADIPLPAVLALGDGDGDGDAGARGARFSMTVLALRTAARCNGVSKLHGEVARAMWRPMFPGVPAGEVPVTSVTNGVHAPTWVAPEIAALLEGVSGDGWRTDASGAAPWAAAAAIPDADLWSARTVLRARLVATAHARGGATARALDPAVLTVAFARRFATYKRATLLLRDRARLARLVGDAQRPVQFVFAGKAHPRDEPGKQLLRELVEAARDSALRGRLVFLEDYDMALARALVAGADVWLNTPRRPFEASGTSGMKSGMNGGLNLSVLDGWWSEAYTPGIGWALGGDEAPAETAEGLAAQDAADAEALYQLLETEVAPSFYARDARGVPGAWCAAVKRAMAVVGGTYNTHRMVAEYAARCYVPAAARAASLAEDNAAGARDLARYATRVAAAWPDVRVVAARTQPAGDVVAVEADVQLGALAPDDVAVEAYAGARDDPAERPAPATVALECAGRAHAAAGPWRFRGAVRADAAATHALAVRVVPRHPALESAFDLGLVRWSSGRLSS